MARRKVRAVRSARESGTEKTAYRFRRLDNGRVVTLRMTFGELIERLDVLGNITLDDGAEAKRIIDHTPKTGPQRRKTYGTAWNRPLISRSLGVHPSQVQEHREQAKAAGLTGVDYLKDGRAVLSTRGNRNGLLRLRGNGLGDFDAGYGDV